MSEYFERPPPRCVLNPAHAFVILALKDTRTVRIGCGIEESRNGPLEDMIQLGKAKTVDRAQIERVRDAVEALLPAKYDDVAVMVNQIECKEDGCPPIETVVSLLFEGNPKKFKVFKPVAEVSDQDVKDGLTTLEGVEILSEGADGSTPEGE